MPKRSLWAFVFLITPILGSTLVAGRVGASGPVFPQSKDSRTGTSTLPAAPERRTSEQEIEDVLHKEEQVFCANLHAFDCQAKFLKGLKYRRVKLGPRGQQGLIVELSLNSFCGSGGCSLYAIRVSRSGYKKILEGLGSLDGLKVANTTTRGFYDLILAGRSEHRFAWDGTRYVEFEPLRRKIQWAGFHGGMGETEVASLLGQNAYVPRKDGIVPVCTDVQPLASAATATIFMCQWIAIDGNTGEVNLKRGVATVTFTNDRLSNASFTWLGHPTPTIKARVLHEPMTNLGKPQRVSGESYFEWRDLPEKRNSTEMLTVSFSEAGTSVGLTWGCYGDEGAPNTADWFARNCK